MKRKASLMASKTWAGFLEREKWPFKSLKPKPFRAAYVRDSRNVNKININFKK